MTLRPAPTSVATLVCAFAGLGGTAAVIPAVLPTAASRFPAEAGTYLRAAPTTFTGLLLGVLLAAALVKVTSLQVAVAVGSLVQAAAMAALLGTPRAIGFLVAAGCAGLGFGLVEAAGSALAREVAATSVTRLLAALTGTVALVAACCPLIVAFLPQPTNVPVALGLVAALHLATTACVVATATDRRRGRAEPLETTGCRPTSPPEPPRSRGNGTVRIPWPARSTAGVAVALALYVGVELVYSGWSAVIADDLLAAGAHRAALGTSAFWFLMATGRFAAWRVQQSRPAQTRHLVSTLAGAATLLLVAATTSTPVASVMVCGAVVLLGPCYSMIIGLGLARTPQVDATQVAGPLVACGAVGGAAIPWLLLAGTANPNSHAVPVLSAALLVITGALLIVGRPTGVPHKHDHRATNA